MHARRRGRRAAAVRHEHGPRGVGAVQRLGRAAVVRAGVGDPGAAMAARRRVRRAAHPRAVRAERVGARAVGGARAGRRDVPCERRTLSGAGRGEVRAHPRDGEDPRADRRQPRRAALRRRARRRHRRPHPERCRRRALLRRVAPSRMAKGGWHRRVPRPDRRTAQGASCAARRAGPAAGRAAAGGRPRRRARRTRRGTGPGDVPRAGVRGRQGAVLPLGRRLLRAQHWRRVVRHRPHRGDGGGDSDRRFGPRRVPPGARRG